MSSATGCSIFHIICRHTQEIFVFPFYKTFFYFINLFQFILNTNLFIIWIILSASQSRNTFFYSIIVGRRVRKKMHSNICLTIYFEGELFEWRRQIFVLSCATIILTKKKTSYYITIRKAYLGSHDNGTNIVSIFLGLILLTKYIYREWIGRKNYWVIGYTSTKEFKWISVLIEWCVLDIKRYCILP